MQKALQKGYKVLQIYEVWHFHEVVVYDPDTNEGGLFAGYVNAFLKMKQEASDWPFWCRTDEQKHQYIGRYFEKEGIHLEWHVIVSLLNSVLGQDTSCLVYGGWLK